MQGTANGEAWKMKDEVSYESRKKGRPGRSIGLVGNCRGRSEEGATWEEHWASRELQRAARCVPK
jgi:hypothetical protein